MNIKNIFLVPVTLLFFACDSPEIKTKITPPVPADSGTKDTATVKITEPAKPGELSEFRNIEMYERCVLLPLHLYREIDDSLPLKGYHHFEPKKKSSDHPELSHLGEFRRIDVQVFMIDEKNYHKPTVFYERDLTDIEESNLATDTSYVLNDFYYIRGHLPNYSELKFVKLGWVGEDKVVLDVVYHADEQASWESWLKEIITRGVNCKN
ncbi:MAG: hypothetical protein FD123_216 [Bacteroidetes bacterium]|nr:MAG: hypothetical protein FD123_216 [Bacteroidota bacterium]